MHSHICPIISLAKKNNENDINTDCSPMNVRTQKVGNNLRFELQAAEEEEEETAEKTVEKTAGEEAVQDIFIQNDTSDIIYQDNLGEDPYSKLNKIYSTPHYYALKCHYFTFLLFKKLILDIRKVALLEEEIKQLKQENERLKKKIHDDSADNIELFPNTKVYVNKDKLDSILFNKLVKQIRI